MDNFTFGMFGEMDDYNAREEAREFEEADRMEAEDWAEDWTDEEWEEIDRQEAQKEEDDWWNY